MPFEIHQKVASLDLRTAYLNPRLNMFLVRLKHCRGNFDKLNIFLQINKKDLCKNIIKCRTTQELFQLLIKHYLKNKTYILDKDVNFFGSHREKIPMRHQTD